MFDFSGDSARKRRAESVPAPFHHTYVMKLFDRSVDLAQFEEDTPLYPICRAWMANQPRNPQSIVKYVNILIFGLLFAAGDSYSSF